MGFRLKSMQENLEKASDYQRNRELPDYVKPVRTEDDLDIQNKKIHLPGKKSAYISHGQGMRYSQEDTADVFSFTDFNIQGIKQVAQKFYKSIIKLQDEIEEGVATRLYSAPGATFNASLQIAGNIVTANVGDSRAILITRSDSSKPFSAQALSWDHKPNDPAEKLRIESAGGFVAYGRLQGSLAVSRAMGDVLFDHSGISHEPDLTCIQLDNNQEAYIVNCCDGVTDVMGETEIAEFFNHIDIKKDNPANLLRREAYFRGSLDNITVCFTPVIYEASNAILSYVADGHGGNQVSHFIYKHYKNIFKSVET